MASEQIQLLLILKASFFHFLTVSYWCNYRQKHFLITYKVMAD